MKNNVVKNAEERQRKIIANAEARLKKIADAAKSDIRAPLQKKSSMDDGFVDFEVDSFVNEPSTCFPAQSCVTPPSPTEETRKVADSTGNGSDPSTILNGIVNDTNGEQLHQLLSGANAYNFATPSFTSNMMASGSFSNGRLNNGMNQDIFNFAGLSQNPEDLGNLLNALSGLASAAPQPRTHSAARQEETHPALNPVLNLIVFFILGIITRVLFELTTLNMNAFAPFLCLAVPLAIMSWGRRPQPVTGLLSAVLLFVRSPFTQTMIISWVRLTTLLRGLSRLFACYFFAFVVTHVFLELSSLTVEINTLTNKMSS